MLMLRNRMGDRHRFVDLHRVIRQKRTFVLHPARNKIAAENQRAQAAENDSNGFEGNKYQHGLPPQRSAHTIYPYSIELFVGSLCFSAANFPLTAGEAITARLQYNTRLCELSLRQ